jgi:hypothetical protein
MNTGQAGVKKFRVGPRAAEFVSLGQRSVFPSSAIQELARDLNRSSEKCILLSEVEAAAVSFVVALGKSGWQFYQPYNVPQN